MGKVTSNFNEKSLKESRVRDKQRDYNTKLNTFGGKGGGIDWKSMSPPVMSKPINGKVVVRQYGLSAEPIGYAFGLPNYEKLGVQSTFDVDPETGALVPSGEIPQIIRFKRSAIPASYTDSIKKAMRDWAEMVRGIEDEVPDVNKFPMFTRDHVDRIRDYDDGYNDDIARYDAAHDFSDAGQIISRHNEVMSDENVKNIIAAYDRQRNSTPVNKNILGVFKRRF